LNVFICTFLYLIILQLQLSDCLVLMCIVLACTLNNSCPSSAGHLPSFRASCTSWVDCIPILWLPATLAALTVELNREIQLVIYRKIHCKSTLNWSTKNDVLAQN